MYAIRSYYGTKLVNPKFQGGAAILIIAVVIAAGALVAVLLYRDLRQVLGDASARGHYGFPTPFRVVSDVLLRQLLALFALVFARDPPAKTRANRARSCRSRMSLTSYNFV